MRNPRQHPLPSTCDGKRRKVGSPRCDSSAATHRREPRTPQSISSSSLRRAVNQNEVCHCNVVENEPLMKNVSCLNAFRYVCVCVCVRLCSSRRNRRIMLLLLLLLKVVVVASSFPSLEDNPVDCSTSRSIDWVACRWIR